MAEPPFQNIRLAPGQKFDQAKQQQVFDSIERNFEDLYNRYLAKREVEELATFFKKSEIIRGSVNGAGVPAVGSGFSASKTGTGIYKITLTKALPTVGIITATPSEFNRLVRVSTANKSEFVLNFVTLAEVAGDTAFHFHIIAS